MKSAYTSVKNGEKCYRVTIYLSEELLNKIAAVPLAPGINHSFNKRIVSILHLLV